MTQFFREISKGQRADRAKKENVAVLYYAGIEDRCKFNIFQSFAECASKIWVGKKCSLVSGEYN
jgi:hypothetical protein